MKFSIFKSNMAPQGEECTYEKYLEVATSARVCDLCKQISKEEDHEARAKLKKQLPVITWQAFFPGRRKNDEAQPSGLFMLDIDHVETPWTLYNQKIASRVKELGIVFVGVTASRQGLRIIAKCKPGLKSIEHCQRWLAGNLKVEYDGVCKDWARCSYVVDDTYTYFMDAKAIWQDEPEEGTIYDVNGEKDDDVKFEQDNNDEGETQSTDNDDNKGEENNDHTDQREGLFGGPKDYKGIPYETIAKEWLNYTGGEPSEGERNSRLYKLALRMRYITDFNATTMLRVMPRYGLSEEEMKSLISSALKAKFGADIPTDMRETLEYIDKKIKLGSAPEVDEDEAEVITSTSVIPPLPPVFRQWAEVAPSDFVSACVLCQLPILGALGSKLRAEYLDGKLHSPSFQVSMEAPQASGKSFLVMLVNYELSRMMESDMVNREKEKEYNEKLAQIKLTNTKISEKQKAELGEKPQGIIRYVPPTMSITMLMKRMYAAKGLHLFAFGEEIDTVYKAFKRSFSSFSDALRVSFDNGLYGQDYASENSFSGIVQLFYNCLFSGTPAAMRRFYPDVEDGLVSRVLFVTLPDQFGKPMPVWKKFDDKQKRIVDLGLEKLNEVTLQGEDIQPEHVMKMPWLNKAMEEWIRQQQLEALRTNDRTRDIFCRRAAVVGFRAGMLGWFLWDEKNTPTIRKSVCRFAIWVANNMLNQHLLRFTIKNSGSNVNHWEELYKTLGDTFTRKELEESVKRLSIDTTPSHILYKWKLLDLIVDGDQGRSDYGRKITVNFKKKHDGNK